MDRSGIDRGGDAMELRELAVDDLVLDEKLNLRDQLDPEAIERYTEAWDRLPPVSVFEVDGRWLLVDGFHRHASALRANRRQITAEVHQGTFNEALDFAATANLGHGLPLTRAERRRAAETRLRLHPDWSDRRLAEESGLSRELFARVRKELQAAGLIPSSSSRVGADGKTYPSAGLPRDPNERLPRDSTGGGQDDPRDRGRSEADAPWDDARDPMPAPPRGSGPSGPSASGGGFPSAPWDDASAKAVALAAPVAVAESSIDEMVGVMIDQVQQLIGYLEAPDFHEAYASAKFSTQNQFEEAVQHLAACVSQLGR